MGIMLMLAAVAAWAGPAEAAQPQPDRSNVVQVDPADVAMRAAVERARAGLPGFFSRLAAPGANEGDFALKFDLAGSGEFIWAGDLRREGGRLTGALGNDPIHPDYRIGQRVEIPEAGIIDWGFVRGVVMQGHHTTRVLLDQMDPAQAAAYRSALGW